MTREEKTKMIVTEVQKAVEAYFMMGISGHYLTEVAEKIVKQIEDNEE